MAKFSKHKIKNFAIYL